MTRTRFSELHPTVFALAAGLSFLSGAPVFAGGAKAAVTDVAPGPSSMSDEEKAIVADPNAGAQHGVILVEQTDLDESGQKYKRYSYHLRAKILSSEGRDLADLVLPLDPNEGDLVEWWGRTILPDGRTLELGKEDLKRSVHERARGADIAELKGVLPGVEPGCVIDYGFVFHDRSFLLSRWTRVPLQRRWPVRSFTYRWVPSLSYVSGFLVSRAGGMAVEATRTGLALKVVGSDLKPVVREAWGPPEESLRASVSLFYFTKTENGTDFWNSEAKKVEGRVAAFLKSGARITGALPGLGLDPASPLVERLRKVEAWIAATVRQIAPGRTDGLEAYREDQIDLPKDLKRKTADDVLAAGEGSAIQKGLVLIGFARALGLDAHLVLAADRTDHYWDRNIVTMWQFDEALVVIRDPAQPAAPPILAEPGLGLGVGEIPWWISGAVGLEATPQGAKDLLFPGSDPNGNVSETTAKADLREDGTATVSWKVKFSGESGLLDGVSLRGKTLDDRQKSIDELCGGADGVDVSKAAAPGVDAAGAALALECEGETLSAGSTGEQLSFRLAEPLIADFPDLPRGARTMPVILDFPRVDRLSLEVAAPAGWKGGAAPAPVRSEGPFGSYVLTITPSPAGFTVQRSLSILRPKVDPGAYRGFEKFLNDARTADRAQLTFVKAGR